MPALAVVAVVAALVVVVVAVRVVADLVYKEGAPRRAAVNAEVNATHQALDRAEQRYIDVHRKAMSELHTFDPWTPEVAAARREFNAAKAKYDDAYHAYRALPEEADAFAVEASFKAHMDQVVAAANGEAPVP